MELSERPTSLGVTPRGLNSLSHARFKLIQAVYWTLHQKEARRIILSDRGFQCMTTCFPLIAWQRGNGSTFPVLAKVPIFLRQLGHFNWALMQVRNLAKCKSSALLCKPSAFHLYSRSCLIRIFIKRKPGYYGNISKIWAESYGYLLPCNELVSVVKDNDFPQ